MLGKYLDRQKGSERRKLIPQPKQNSIHDCRRVDNLCHLYKLLLKKNKTLRACLKAAEKFNVLYCWHILDLRIFWTAEQFCNIESKKKKNKVVRYQDRELHPLFLWILVFNFFFFPFHLFFLNPGCQALSIRLCKGSELTVYRLRRFFCGAVGGNGQTFMHHYMIQQNSV